MTRGGSGPATLSVLLAAILTSGCGSSRQLQSVSLSPATADAQNGDYSSHLWVTVLAMLYGTGLRRGHPPVMSMLKASRSDFQPAS
jgi:hypothetical protein